VTVIAQDVFKIAMDLMDEESQDGTFTGYPNEYKKKAWSFLNIMQSELLPPAVTPLAVTSENSILQLDDKLSMTALPYGLAAHLLMNEDQSRAAFYNARYDELRRKQPIMVTAIDDIYGFTGTPDEDTSKTGTSDGLDGGSFLDVNAGIWDGGGF
jgi:hypothetical protein